MRRSYIIYTIIYKNVGEPWIYYIADLKETLILKTDFSQEKLFRLQGRYKNRKMRRDDLKNTCDTCDEKILEKSTFISPELKIQEFYACNIKNLKKNLYIMYMFALPRLSTGA